MALGAGVRASRRVSGGDINRALCLELDDGRRVFVKYSEGAPAGLFEAEARGLAWLAEAEALPVPTVLAVGPAAAPFLALEWIETGRRDANFDELLGRGLARLHDSGADDFGLDHDNFIATLPQANAPLDDWPSFYSERRLRPLIRRAVDAGCLPSRTQRALDELLGRMPELVGEPEAPSRLHGDLWGGNLMCGPSGQPRLIDPAVYAGHRELDLAMMRLFGGFGSKVFAAYAEAHPLSPDHAARVPLYQLYPLLVHVLLFGGGYVGQLDAAARAALS
ncbi:MAG: fructosamine kinase family protein [Deltaproteobacteria bacterium]|nr:fructosamine kinase family protein [Deltaproteobacteria bacterium]